MAIEMNFLSSEAMLDMHDFQNEREVPEAFFDLLSTMSTPSPLDSGLLSNFGWEGVHSNNYLDLLSPREEVEEEEKSGTVIRIPIIYDLKTKIGPLTLAQRREKVKRFLDKRKRRNWQKKIKYSCRKKVAENRVRVKGRFVTN